MKKKIFLFSYIAIMCIFVGYLFMADSVFYKIGIAKNFLSEIKKYENDYSINQSGVVNVDIVSSRSDLLRTIEIQGLAGIPTDADNKNAYAKLVFKGEKNSYIIDTCLGFSGNINDFFKVDGIRGITHKFKTEFSILSMQNGVYRLYVYYNENSESNGLIDTYKIFEKSSIGLTEYVPPKMKNVSYTSSDSIFAYFYDNQSCCDGKYYKISGVAGNLAYDSVGSKVYLQFTFDDGKIVTYDTVVAKGWWTSTNLDKKYHESSFYAKVPKDVLSGKNVQMRILVDNNGVYSYNRVFNLEFDDLGYIIKESERVYLSPIQNLGEFESGLYVSTNIWNAFSDNQDINGYFFNGITYVKDLPSNLSSAYIRFCYNDGTVITYPMVLGRNDWMEERYGSTYSNTTFRVEIAKEDFKLEDVSVDIIIENGGKLFITKESTEYTYSDGVFVKK